MTLVTVVTRGHYDVRGQKKMTSDADEDSNRHIVEYDDGIANHFADEAYALFSDHFLRSMSAMYRFRDPKTNPLIYRQVNLSARDKSSNDHD